MVRTTFFTPVHSRCFGASFYIALDMLRHVPLETQIKVLCVGSSDELASTVLPLGSNSLTLHYVQITVEQIVTV